MAKTTDLLCFVETISSHFHAAHGGHLGVHVQKLLLADLDSKIGLVSLEHFERRLGQGDSDLLGGGVASAGQGHPGRSSGREGALWQKRKKRQCLFFSANYTRTIWSTIETHTTFTAVFGAAVATLASKRDAAVRSMIEGERGDKVEKERKIAKKSARRKKFELGSNLALPIGATLGYLLG